MAAYNALELGQPGNAVCPDKYEVESTLYCPGSTRLILQTSTAAIKLQFGVFQQGRAAGLGSIVWQAEQPFLPIVASLGRVFDAVRVRNYTPGVKAQVMIAADVS
jgi:hypothetical protein